MSIIIKGITKAQFYKDANKIPNMDAGWDIEELPPHGRLIDADALVADTSFFDGGDWHYGYSRRMIENAKTILEAEDGKE